MAEKTESPEQVGVTSEEQTTPVEASLHVGAVSGDGSGAESTNQDEQARETEPDGSSETPDTSKNDSEQSCSSLTDSMKKLQTASAEESTSSKPVFRVESANKDSNFKIKINRSDVSSFRLFAPNESENSVEQLNSSLNEALGRLKAAYESNSKGMIATSAYEKFFPASAKREKKIEKKVTDPILNNPTETPERTESLKEYDNRHEDIPKDSDGDDTRHEKSPPS